MLARVVVCQLSLLNLVIRRKGRNYEAVGKNGVDVDRRAVRFASRYVDEGISVITASLGDSSTAARLLVSWLKMMQNVWLLFAKVPNAVVEFWGR
jgi:hypothetical protein